MNNFGITMETIIEPLAVIEENKDYIHETYYFVFQKDNVSYILETIRNGYNLEIQHLTNTSYRCIDLEQKQIKRNPNYKYFFYIFEEEKTLETFLDDFNLWSSPVDKEIFLKKLGYTDFEDSWNTLFSEIKNSGITMEELKTLLKESI